MLTGRATRILLTISTLGIFRVVKIITLILVKCLIHSYLQGAPTTSALRTGVRRQPDGMSEANLWRRYHPPDL